MKRESVIFIAGWALIAVTAAAGFGVTHFFEARFSPATHQLIAAIGQLVPLAGLFLLALLHEGKNRADHT
jgi:hypothetical protein